MELSLSSGQKGLRGAFLTLSPTWKVNMLYGDHSYNSKTGDITIDRVICTGEMCYRNDFTLEAYTMNAKNDKLEPRLVVDPENWDLDKGAFVFCCFKTGKEVSSNLFFTPDPAKPLSGVTEVVRFRPQ